MDSLHPYEESASQEALPQEAKVASHKNTPSPVSLGQSSQPSEQGIYSAWHSINADNSSYYVFTKW